MADADRIRIDKWLWQARFCKTRSLAAGTVASGRVRINGERSVKPGRAIGPGDVLTLGLGGGVRVVRVLHCGSRRGPAPEAQTLYEEVSQADNVPDLPVREE
ncbi:Heat shock protein 15 [Defluviimonas aquaemixtae]|uniref:Heat shock protein 15 n=1 Tax=Albidovulum aquaemixtae TaxID=1542388 RepID=A0A2R8B7N8_9RHOB|nr:RNA-binding S4 domain-containing protein [Defluviimonas aquaemixtae]SPH18645.1 Heat shock protein 15 [Defluviimonas aquaemixtae]